MLDIKFYILIDAIATHGSVHEAAAAIGLTQPAASHRIREMERRLGVTLFMREGRRLLLNASGKRLLETAREVLPELRRAELEAWQLARRREPALRMGIGPYDTFSRVVPLFYEKYNRDIDMMRVPMDDMVTYLLAQRVEMILLNEVPVQRGIAHVAVFEQPILAILPPSHPYASADAVPANVYEKTRHFTYCLRPEAGHEFELFFQPADIYPSHMILIESVKLVLDLVAAGQGVSILSRWAAWDASQAGKIVMRPLQGQTPYVPWYIAYIDEPHIAEAAAQMAGILRDLYGHNS